MRVVRVFFFFRFKIECSVHLQMYMVIDGSCLLEKFFDMLLRLLVKKSRPVRGKNDKKKERVNFPESIGQTIISFV